MPKTVQTRVKKPIKPVRVDVNPQDHLRLRIAAARQGLSMSAYVRSVMMAAIAKEAS